MNPLAHWSVANQDLVAKSIGELSYEQILSPILVSPNSYELHLKTGIVYRFRAWKTVWDFLRVDPRTLERRSPQASSIVDDAATFFKDAQSELEMTDLVLGQFLEEMQSTLFADTQLLEKFGDVSVQNLASKNGNEVQSYLNGHPKLLLNKGRLGWGASDLSAYSPESESIFQLHWLNIAEGIMKSEGRETGAWTSEDRALESLDAATVIRLRRNGFELLPVHPWQWDRIIRIQFAREIAEGKIVFLGPAGDFYRPQISLRTLSNQSRPGKADIKLPLSVLNTSAVRGIPERYISTAPKIAEMVASLCELDPVLKRRRTTVLKDLAGAAVPNPAYADLNGVPYRYKETLGAIWRESVDSKLAENELAILTGSLFHKDRSGQSLIGAYVHRSGLSTSDWLKRYFEAAVIPLYHLQVKYGLGLVAHGQNIVLRLTNFSPSGLFLKDFQGDLRSSSDTSLPPLEARGLLDQLPPHHLIHDLITGHFVTVLRFVSATLQESENFSEDHFYSLLAQSIQAYLKDYPVDPHSFANVDLLKDFVPRVLLNKVRFRIGYGDRAERPAPLLGQDLPNPLARKEMSPNE